MMLPRHKRNLERKVFALSLALEATGLLLAGAIFALLFVK